MMRLRQVALVATDLAAAEAAITGGLGVELCFRDPGVGHFGLHNALFPIGDQFLEVVAPTQEGTTAGRLLDKRGGDGGYMAIFQTDDVQGARDRLAQHGIRLIYEAKAEGMLGLHLHPKDVGGAIVSVDWSEQPAEWLWAGTEWRDHVRTDVVDAVVGLEIQDDDPAETARRWAAVLDRPVSEALTIDIDDATISFVPVADGRGPGLAGITVRAADRSRAGSVVELVGTRFTFA